MEKMVQINVTLATFSGFRGKTCKKNVDLNHLFVLHREQFCRRKAAFSHLLGFRGRGEGKKNRKKSDLKPPVFGLSREKRTCSKKAMECDLTLFFFGLAGEKNVGEKKNATLTVIILGFRGKKNIEDRSHKPTRSCCETLSELRRGGGIEKVTLTNRLSGASEGNQYRKKDGLTTFRGRQRETNIEKKMA